ncbi:MAG TPA: hypothetical protein PKE55_14765, partial [Kiritimatiellia bacterium]|nr:hypothetical protein [Kiritimatiellia bacterium]
QTPHALHPLPPPPPDIPPPPNLITLPANTRFTYRHRLQSVQLQTTNATPGQSIGINFQWHTPRNVPWTPKLPQLAVWIHGIKQGDTQPSFYGDRYLLADLATPSTFPDLPPYLHTITLPHDLPPGAYDLNVGLWLPNQNRTLRVRHSILPSNRRGVIVATLNVQ